MNTTNIDFHSTNAVDFDSKYSTRPDFKERLAVWQKLLDIHIPPSSQVLDVGCGSGVFSFYLLGKGHRVTGIDGAAGMIDFCRKKATQLDIQKSLHFEKANIPDDLLRFQQPGGLDAVIGSSVLEFIPDLDRTIRVINDLLKSGGICIISIPNNQSFYRLIEKMVFRVSGKPAYYQHVHHVLTASQFDSLMKKHGFERLALEYYAGQNLLSGFLSLFLKPIYWRNIFVGVYRKNNPDA